MKWFDFIKNINLKIDLEHDDINMKQFNFIKNINLDDRFKSWWCKYETI